MAALPDEPPDDPDTLVAWASALADNPPDARRQALEALPPASRDPWSAVLDRLYARPADDGSGPAATALLEFLQRAGLASEEARNVLGELASLDPVQEAWADWTRVADPREVRERSQALSRASRVTAGQADFLHFALRASDPAVYHPAALAVGRHAGSTPAVQDILDRYTRERGLAIDEPVRLDGTRTRRRLLLIQAGARLGPPGDPGDGGPLKEDPSPPLPADLPEDASATLPGEPADVASLLRAVTTLVEAGDSDPLLERGATALAESVAGLPEARLTRWVVEAWADLLAVLPDPEAGRGAAARLLPRLAAVPDPEDGPLATPLAALLRLDVGLQVLPELPAALAADLLAEVREAVGPGIRAVVHARAATWAARHPADDPGWVDDAVDRLAHAREDPLLVSALEALREPHHPGTRTLESVGEALRTGPSWAGRSPRERALLAFLALDAVRAGRPPSGRARALLDDAGLLPVAARPGDSLLGLLLEGLLTREPPGADAFLDARFLHEAASPRLLLAVLSPEASVDAASLADALEHQIRVALQADPAFEPAAFLTRTAVRRPDPAVYRALAEVSADRTYERPDGTPFTLEAVARGLARDGAETRSPGDAWDEAPEGVPPGLGPARGRLRDRLSTLRNPGAPDEAVRGLVDAVGAGPPGGASPPDTVRGLLRAVHPREGPLLAAGRPAWRTASRSELEDALGDALRRAEDRIPDLRPDLVGEVEEGADPAADVADALAEVRALAVPHLPGPEADLLEAAFAATETRLARWSRGVEALREAWDPEAGLEGARSLLEAVTVGWSPPERLPILEMALRTLADRGYPHALLEWAAGFEPPGSWSGDERAAWRSWRRSLWDACLESAMERERPDRLAELLGLEAYRRERAHPESRASLEAARSWGYERYRLGPAVAVERARSDGPAPAAWVRATAGYVGHFSPVWLALAVGAILMLDFGDPWREMAAAGDVQGVAITAALGVGGAFAYVLSDLGARVGPGRGSAAGEEPRRDEEAAPRPAAGARRGGAPSAGRGALGLAPVARAGGFVALCLAWALAVTGGLWWLLSGTDQVVRGAGAPLHVTVWAGFALFVGIFFGLVAKEA